MVSAKVKIGIASVVTFLLYVAYCVLTAIGLYGTNYDSLYPQNMKDTLEKYDILLMPTFKTFSCLVVVYVLQFIWILYSLSCMCRQGSGTEVFSIKFFISFSLSLFFSVGAGFAWWKSEVVGAFILLIFQLIFIELAFGVCCYDLYDYLKTHDVNDDNINDVRCFRYLVQNGVQFGVAASILVFIGVVSVFFHHELGATNFSVSLGMLILIGVLEIVWFVLETFPLREYTEWTVSSYIVIIYYLSGLVAKVWGEDKTIAGFAIAFLVISCILLLVRIFIVEYRFSKRGSYENISYSAKTQSVNA